MKLLTIRDAQMAALTDAFDLRWLRGEFEALYPAQCAAMGPEEATRFVEACRKRARAHGIGRQDHLLYLALEMIFGETFTQETWAQQALAGDGGTAMDRLREAAVFRLAAVAEHEQRQEEADRQTMALEEEPSAAQDEQDAQVEEGNPEADDDSAEAV